MSRVDLMSACTRHGFREGAVVFSSLEAQSATGPPKFSLGLLTLSHLSPSMSHLRPFASTEEVPRLSQAHVILTAGQP